MERPRNSRLEGGWGQNEWRARTCMQEKVRMVAQRRRPPLDFCFLGHSSEVDPTWRQTAVEQAWRNGQRKEDSNRPQVVQILWKG
ncbi:hypothetical protein BC939DRAFT_180362 [Gamsiella multidivaricata]|uniref:uncharacterized protein n=1 Tax=Gamsiella multidivaricata TaxID=101098 RepID=UPI0022206AB9|nr:uncharacterized protein BC939DRAFT_180362 [Gamsiella multidivaricata]KAI7822571.1 hypothetical protein BC939DRAFT_180362 [Gamsiella multidivaricata]